MSNISTDDVLVAIYIIMFLLSTRLAMPHFMRQLVWYCYRGYGEYECKRHTDWLSEDHRGCGERERGEVRPRDTEAFLFCLLCGTFWPIFITYLLLSKWAGSAPLTQGERLRVLREREEEIDRLEKKVLEHDDSTKDTPWWTSPHAKEYIERNRNFYVGPAYSPRPELAAKRPTMPPPDTGWPNLDYEPKLEASRRRTPEFPPERDLEN